MNLFTLWICASFHSCSFNFQKLLQVTTVGEALSKKFGWEFADADDFHPAANKSKMEKGIPLTDEDRIPWLKSIHQYMCNFHNQKKHAVVTCSALKKSYRNILKTGEGSHGASTSELSVVFVHLKGDRALLLRRMEARSGHFMPASLLDSQLDTLEELDVSEDSITVDISLSVPDVVDHIVTELKLS